MSTVWFRSNQKEDWRTVDNWQGLPESLAHSIADRYNVKYSSMYWVTNGEKPGRDSVPDGK